MVPTVTFHTINHAERPLGSSGRSEGARIEFDWSRWTALTSKVPRDVTTMLENEGIGRDPRHFMCRSGE